MRKVMVFGTFDILHEGHLFLLREAKKFGDYLIVIVARDETVKEFKGEIPLNSEVVRVQQLVDCGLADKIRLGNRGDKHQVLNEENPDTIVLGYDQDSFVSGLEKYGIEIKRVKAFKPEIYKSSIIKQQLRKL